MRFNRSILAAMALPLLLAVGAMAATTGYTGTGDNESGAQTWTYQGRLSYSAAEVSGGVTQYSWNTDPAWITLAPDVHYEDADVYYRTVLIYDVTTVVWESSQQSVMDCDVQVDDPYEEHYYNPGSSYFQGATANDVVYKVQTAPAQNTDIRAEQFTLLKDI